MKVFRHVTLALLACIISLPVSADVWLVDSNPSNEADFRDLPQAHDDAAVASGDTLYLRGSIFNYSGYDISKQLFIVGPGYFLNENPGSQSYLQSASITGSIRFLVGSEGSSIIGLDLSFTSVTIEASNVALVRNKIFEAQVRIRNKNVSILQNYFFISSSNIENIRLEINTSAEPDTYALNVIIANNYIQTRNAFTNNINGNNQTDAIVSNNIINGGGVEVDNSTIQNNIFIGGDIEGSLNNIQNNLSDGDSIGSENGNQANVNMEQVFLGFEGNSTDGQWQLAPGSPAIGAGINGEDAGIFGGDAPYVLSGIPSIPRIISVSVPASGSFPDGIPVRVQARTSN